MDVHARRATAGFLCMVLLGAMTAACSSHKPPKQFADVAVEPGRAAALVMPGGARVDVPADGVSGTGRLSGEVVTSPPAAPDGMLLQGQVVDFKVNGTALTGSVTVTMPVGQGQEPDAALLAFYDPASKAWQPAGTQYDPTAHTVAGTSPHLSVWAAFRLDPAKVRDRASNLMRGLFGVAAKAEQPVCPRQDQAAGRGIAVASDSGDLVKWCVGVDEQGAAVLQVANNRSYSVEIQHPASWRMRRLGASDPLLDQAVAFVAGKITSTRSGTAVVIVPGGHTVQFTVPAGGSGLAETRPSVPAYLLDALLYGVDTLVMTFDKIPGAPGGDPSKSAKALKLAFESKDCLAVFDRLTHNEVTDAHSAGEVFYTAAQLAVGCLGAQWEVAYGVTGLVWSFLGKVVLWFVEGIKLVIQGVRAAIDNVIYWRSYRIQMTVPAGVQLADAAVAGVATGGSGADVEQRLRAALGAPSKSEDVREGCELGGGPKVLRRHLTWGPLTVVVSEPGTAKAALVGWTVLPGTLPGAVTLPYGVTTTTTVKQAMTKIPGAQAEWQDPFQVYLVQSDQAPHMSWMGDSENGSGTLGHITNMWEPCD